MRIKRVAIWAVPLLVVGTLAYLLGYSNLLSVKQLEINELGQRPDAASVIARPDLNLKIGAQLARVNVRGAESALTKIGWVERSKVSRNWISGKVEISITARTPVAKVVAQDLGGDSYIDLAGKIYQDSSISKPLPVITIGDSKLASEAARFISTMPMISSDLLAKMKDLTLSAQGDFEMQVADLGHLISIRFGNGSDLAKKVEIYNRLIALPENKKVTSIDLSDPKYPIAKS
jgi:cell division septal protein FtsQ